MKMRKVISAFLALSCIFSMLSLFTLGAAAEGERVVYATTGDAVRQGSYGYLYVYLDDLTELSALNVSVYYDTEKITVKSATNVVSNKVYDITTADGCVNTSYIFDGKGVEGKTNLFYVYYQVNSTAEVGDTYFEVVVTEAYDNSLNDIPCKGSRCAFAVTEKSVSKNCYVYSTSTVSTSVGEEFELTYRFDSYQVASGSLAIQYDPELFEVVSATEGDFLSNKIADVNTELDGAVYVSFVGTSYQYKYNIVTVRFKTLKNVSETSEIKLTANELCDVDLNSYTCSGYTTQVKISFDESYTEDAPSMSVSAVYSQATGKVTATVYLEKESMLGAGDFVLSFDSKVLTYESAQQGFSPSFFIVNEEEAADGILKFYIISMESITDEQTVLTVTFNAEPAKEAQDSEIFISGSVLTDHLGNSVVLNFVDGSVIIPEQKPLSVGGKLTSFGAETDTVSAVLIPKGQTEAACAVAVQGNSADYLFENVAPGEYTLRVSKSWHLVYEASLIVDAGDVVHDVTMALGNNGKQFKINSAYLVLTQNINVIYRTTLPENFENPRMVFLFNGEETDITEYTVDEQGRYCYAFTDVYPQKMGDNICATLFATVDGTEVSVCIPTYSVRQYCINKLSGDPDSNLRRMVSDLLVYGEKTQLYQNYKVDELVTAGLSLSPSSFKALGEEYNKHELIGESAEGIRYSSARLELKSDMTVMLGITAEDPTPYTFEVTSNGRTSVFTSDDLYFENGRYYLSFKGVWATQYDDVITAVIKKDGVQVSQTLRYSVYTYVQKNQDTSEQKLCELLKAIYNYGESAKLYIE